MRQSRCRIFRGHVVSRLGTGNSLPVGSWRPNRTHSCLLPLDLIQQGLRIIDSAILHFPYERHYYTVFRFDIITDLAGDCYTGHAFYWSSERGWGLDLLRFPAFFFGNSPFASALIWGRGFSIGMAPFSCLFLSFFAFISWVQETIWVKYPSNASSSFCFFPSSPRNRLFAIRLVLKELLAGSAVAFFFSVQEFFQFHQPVCHSFVEFF